MKDKQAVATWQWEPSEGRAAGAASALLHRGLAVPHGLLLQTTDTLQGG
jgi:hypothetical protein